MAASKTLTFSELKNAFVENAAAFRLTLKLEAISPKVFPPTYEGGKYATEDRIIDGQRLPCVLLDSVPSQANRMELALQEAWSGKQIQLPVISTDFSGINYPGVPKVTSLQAPHRIVDAILRDSTINEGKKPVRFRESTIGRELDLLSTGFATPLLKYAPHCLLFGMWDSTGPRGGLGVKFARAIVSEIIGVNAVAGMTTSSRIDPLNIRAASAVLFESKDGGWTLDEKSAVKDKNGKPMKLGEEGKPSEANHGNVKPVRKDGGFTIDYAEQTTVLSLSALRRLRFPLEASKPSTKENDLTARTYLASLGLLGATLAVESGYDLRSRCILRAADAIDWELLGTPGAEPVPFVLDSKAAVELYKESLEALQKAKLPIKLDEITLTPTADLLTLVQKSMEIAASEPVEGK